MGETWEEFDALPVGLKRVYWNAPYNYTALPAHDACRMGLDLVHFAKRRWHNFGLDVRRESARLYGAPQEGWI